MRDELAALGHEVVVTDDWASGQVTGVRYTPETGLLEGAASPRQMEAYVIGR